MNISMRFVGGMRPGRGAHWQALARVMAAVPVLVPTISLAVDPVDAPLTPLEISTTVEQTRRDCEANQFFAVFHDCSCTAAKVGELRSARGRAPSKEKLLGEAGEACPSDPRVIHAYYFETCAGAVKSMRTDWQAMCTCATDKVLAAYLAHPNPSTRYLFGLQRDALKACGYGDGTHAVRR